MKLWALLLITLLVSCTTVPFRSELMPSPEIYSNLKVTPVSVLEIEKHSVGQRGILFATTREPQENMSKQPFYSNENAYLMRFGAAKLNFTKPLTPEEFQEQSYSENRIRNLKLYVDSVLSLGYLPQSAHPLIYDYKDITPDDGGDSLFLEELSNQLSLSESKSVTIFIHGFRVDFTYPVLIAAQFAYFSGLDETYISYSWPSTYKKLSAYMSDSETATQSGRELRHFIEYLSQHSEIENINIIAHSAGTRLVVEALNEFALLYNTMDEKEAQTTFKINNIILLSGDASANRLLSFPEGKLSRFCNRITLYQSETDRALKVSERKQKQRRIGQAFSHLEPELKDSIFIDYLCDSQEKVTVINSTNAYNSNHGYGHSYFWTSPWVSSDIILQLKYDIPPERRGLTYNEKWCTWEFDDNYPENLRNNISINRKHISP